MTLPSYSSGVLTVCTALVVLGLGLLGAAGLVGIVFDPAYGYAGVAAVGLCLPPALASER